jgi:hypothetical protein
MVEVEREAAPQQRRWRGRPRGGAEEEAARERGGGREAAGEGGGRARGGEAHGDSSRPAVSGKKSVITKPGQQGSAAVAVWRSLVSTGGGLLPTHAFYSHGPRDTGHGPCSRKAWSFFFF